MFQGNIIALKVLFGRTNLGVCLAFTWYKITLNSAYKEKKYAEILPCYRWLFIKGNVFIGEWGIFGAEVVLHYSQFFIKSDFVIGRVECIFPLFWHDMYV